MRALLRNPSKPGHLKPWLEHPHLSVVSGDLFSADALALGLQDVSQVFHLAGMLTANDPQALYRTNAQGTECLAQSLSLELEARKMRSSSVPFERMVYVSSLAAGGPVHDPIERTEAQADAPVSEYGKSKREGELGLRQYFKRLPTTI